MNHLPAIALTLDAQGRPTCLSTDVARHFQKKHQHVLRDIDQILAISSPEHASNFGRMFIDVEIGNGAVRQIRAYRLTRDAFSILAMGFTGSAAIRWKWRYIEAFNALEAAAHETLRAGALEDSARTRRETARLIWKLGPAQKRRLRAVLRYRSMGLGAHNIAKLLDVHKREVSMLLKAADALGWLSAAPRLVQGNLLTDGVASGSEQIAKAARSSRLCRVNRDATPERGKEVDHD